MYSIHLRARQAKDRERERERAWCLVRAEERELCSRASTLRRWRVIGSNQVSNQEGGVGSLARGPTRDGEDEREKMGW